MRSKWRAGDDYRIFKILRIHDGEVSVIEPQELANGILSFQTDRFSTYALVYTDPDSHAFVNNTQLTDNTGDLDTSNSGLWVKTGDSSKITTYIVYMIFIMVLTK